MKAGQHPTMWTLLGAAILCLIQVFSHPVVDNGLVFGQAKYKSTVLEHAKPDKRVINITAQHKLTGTCENIKYEILRDTLDSMYFRIAMSNCVAIIKIAKQIDRVPDQCYNIRVRAYIEGMMHDVIVGVELCVVDKMAMKPYFKRVPKLPITVRKSYNQFQGPLIVLEAISNVPGYPHVNLRLLAGPTEQTNSKHTFRMEQTNNTAFIMLSSWLDVETVSMYVLTIVAANEYGIQTEKVLIIQVKDDKDESLVFTGNNTATISKNAPPGTIVLQVQAVDRDGTSANNVVSYRLETNQNQFAIDSRSGIITLLEKLEHDIDLKVIAEGKPNSAVLMVHIMVDSDKSSDTTSSELVPTIDGDSTNSQEGKDVKITEETTNRRNTILSFLFVLLVLLLVGVFLPRLCSRHNRTRRLNMLNN